MSTPEHGAATVALSNAITLQVHSMGLGEVIQTFVGPSTKADSRGKEADYGWGPRRPPPFAGRLSVALEVAISETQEKLKRDVDFWLNPNEGNANMALTLKVSRNTPMVTFDTLERVNQRSHRTQHITVSKNSGDHITLSGSPMTIPFDLLFQRPISCPAERNIQLADNELKDITSRIWEAQGF
ncbi:uncharacterized protein N7498_005779 [Penicillium cinerascens]|uniref:Uncharacterized protein n=1 Tax=Penicillium cinerascens TaxID=70096 RepID=A0A9W9MP31_9EURO|nr:uncharacterized protein N7498_005779 [Penicillium cinerascens]KAJ5204900.1 hypothetical protein N7498_005779 [Penicillium cinerascens]